MKNIINMMWTIGIIICLSACNKNNDNIFTPAGSINVINAVVGGTSLILNDPENTVSLNSYKWFPTATGQYQLNLYSAATATSPVITYYNQPLAVENAGIYSLFLSGTSPSSVDATFLKESYKSYTDSICGVRFINLSPNSNPISVNIKGNANGSEVTSLAYKAYSDFKKYPAKAKNTSYVFELRDASTGNLVISYTLTTPYFQNVTIVLRGLISAPGIILDKDYY